MRQGQPRYWQQDYGFIRDVTLGGLMMHYDNLLRGMKVALGGVAIRQVMDCSFESAILLGCHAMAGAEDGTMNHSSSFAVELAGRPEVSPLDLLWSTTGKPARLK